ncbi:MAG TPA: hypothetical protein VFU21_12015 [Kofleriaceae bacterium]|nr:hypothetical protein [Kofleriaceae bacterium]
MRARAAIALLLGASACIADPGEGDLKMCDETADCDSASGEVCDDGVCWGGPPEDITFAAVLVPPDDRIDLPVAVIPALSIAADGTIVGLSFPPAITVSGRVLLACPPIEIDPDPVYDCGPERSVGAQITIERTSPFPGGPVLSRTVVAAGAVGPGESAFSFLLPRETGAEYHITITPDDTAGGADIAPGELAPPRQLTISAEGDQHVDWVLGDPDQLKTIRGCVENVVGDGAPFAGMHVQALGRWSQLSPLTRASSRSFTDDEGCFTLRVPIKMLDEFDILVQPAPGAILPTLRLKGEFVRDPIEGELVEHVIEPALVMPTAPAPTSFRLPVEALGSAGGQEPVPGAAVRLTTVFPLPDTELRDIEVTFTAEAVTSALDAQEPGVAEVELYPGSEQNRVYQVQVVPPPDSQFQSAFSLEVPVGVGGSGQVLPPVTLSRRAALTGIAVTAAGDPVASAPVEAGASSSLRLQVESEEVGAIISQLQYPTATTDDDGAFLVWVDRELAGQAALYDVDVSPAPFSSDAPSWTFEDIEVPAEGESVDLGQLVLPEASYARGLVRDRRDAPVVGAEVRIYQLGAEDYCTRVLDIGEADCVPPAHLRGIWASDDSGAVKVVLPDP